MTTFETYFKSNRNCLVCCSKENLSDIVHQAQIKRAEKRVQRLNTPELIRAQNERRCWTAKEN